MNTEFIEAMLSLTYDAPCKYICTKDNSMYFIVESRSSMTLNKVEGETICDNFIETDLDGQIKNCYDFALKTDEYIIIEVKKDVHGKSVRDKILVYNNEMNLISQFVETDTKKYSLKLLDDRIRCIKDSDDAYYNLDGTILKREDIA